MSITRTPTRLRPGSRIVALSLSPARGTLAERIQAEGGIGQILNGHA
jgi:hypothetical protein